MASSTATFDGSNNWKQDFVFDVTGIDRILMLEQADVLDEDGDSNTSELTRTYYHRNAIGSVMYLSTASQGEAEACRYAPFGGVSITRGGVVQGADPLGQPLAFTSRFVDSETSLLYLRARYLDVNTGHFCARDPLDGECGSNAYEYASNRPVVRIDPTGWSDVDPPDLQVRSDERAMPGILPPNLGTPGAFFQQAYLDQWLDDGWFEGADAPTWLIRFRDLTGGGFWESHGTKYVSRVKILGPTGRQSPHQRVATADGCTTESWSEQWAFRTELWRVDWDFQFPTNVDRGSLRARQFVTYGEFLRGSHHISKNGSLRWRIRRLWEGIDFEWVKRQIVTCVCSNCAEADDKKPNGDDGITEPTATGPMRPRHGPDFQPPFPHDPRDPLPPRK